LWIRNSTFKNNWVDDANVINNTNVRGGAIWLDHGMNIIIDKSTFQNNSAVQINANHGLDGGAIAVEGSWETQVKTMIYISNSRFTKNEVRHENEGSSHGGAIHIGAPFTMTNTLIDSNKAGVTSGQGGNRGHGGGLYINISAKWDNQTQIKGAAYLINNTIVDNYVYGSSQASGESGGVHIGDAKSIYGTWFNNIFWGNRSDDQETHRHNLNYVADDQFSSVASDYNDVEFSEHYAYMMGSNSYELDPAFYSATNYQLGTGSPLIGAGASSYDGIAVPA
ncbi:uncharacterized protein METZ01_LOCUS407457, partial [marine metagenome]